ncbi:MAG TPA: hypothetical protein DEA96_00585, partial [Leptospiraceae bacterium]|nr:hypothetical protein [Leptospiraceae bacterium]
HCKSSLSYPASAIGKSLLYRRNPAGGFRGSGTRAPVIALFGMEDEPGWQSVPDAAKNSRWKRIRGLNLRFGPGGLEFKLREDGYEGTVENPHYYSRVQAENLLGCISTLLMAGFSTESVREAARHAAPVSGGRFHILRKDDRILVDDTYNANPDSFLAAIASLRKMLPHGRLLCLAGQMAELGSAGEAGHNEVGHALKLDEYSLQVVGSEGALSYLQGYGIHYRSGQIQKTDSEGNELKAGSSPVVGGASPMTGSLGRDSGADFSADPEKENGQGNVDNRDSDLRFFFPDSAELADHIERHSQFYLSFDGILAKGSRSARMEKACEALKRIGYV